MNYDKLQLGQYFECKIKGTYVEIYVFSLKDRKYYRVFSLQKKDCNGVFGCGEKTTPNANNLVPITLIDEALRTILNKVYPNGMGALQSELNSFANDSLTELHRVDNTVNVFDPNLSANPNIINPNPNPNKETTKDKLMDFWNDLLTKIGDGVVYVNYKAIDCEVLNDEDVEVEEIVEEIVEEGKKDYTKLIWIALGAATLLL